MPHHWKSHINKLKHWNDILWTQNSCVIPAMEACEWWHAVEVYAFLAITVAVEFYNVNFREIYEEIITILKNQQIDQISLPSYNFPSNEDDFRNCPVCKRPLSNTLEEFRYAKRSETWQPAWSPSKRAEGEDGSNQILHIEPLIESQIRHKVGKVKFGHCWCNITMTDHSLYETLNFFECVLKAHNKKYKLFFR